MFKQTSWELKRRGRLYLGSQEMKSSITKFKGSLFAVIFGLIIASFVIIGAGKNPLTYFQLLFLYAFTSWPSNNWDNTLVWWTIYIIAGLALVVSFRTGMFNIGVAGQMLAAGAVVLAIGIRYDLSQPVFLIAALVAGVLASTLVAVVTALLKVCFNVHEVVTSILLNWTIWYLIKWLFKLSNDLFDSNHGTSAAVHDNMNMTIGGYNFILPLVIAIVLVITVWFILKKTTLGYKIRTVGLNPFAAVYGGINDKRYAVISFALSGALAGVMAVIYYIAKNPSISFFTDDLPSIGFDSIAVALVGQINAVGVVGAAFLWGLIKSSGSIGTVLELPTATGDIIFGVIIYSAACAVLLSRLQPIKFLIRYGNIFFIKAKRQTANSIIKKMYQYFADTFRIKKEYRLRLRDLQKQLQEDKAQQVKKLQEEKEPLLTKEHQTQQRLLLSKQNLQQQYKAEVANKQHTAEQLLQIKTTYKKECKLLKETKNTINNNIKMIKEKFNENITKINNDINEKLQVLINERNDKISVCWAYFFQENKTLQHYMYKQYNSLWKKGKIGRWNDVQNQKKNIYAETLNTYINEKIAYETIVYNYKQELIAGLLLLKKHQKQVAEQEPIIINNEMQLTTKNNNNHNNSNILKQQFAKKVALAKHNFNNKWQELSKKEQQALKKIKPQVVKGGKANGSR